MDAKLDSIVEQFRSRLEELVSTGSREKSLALTNAEQAQLWAERARNLASGNLQLKLYKSPEKVGWLGYVEGDQGRGVEYWITLDGECINNTHSERDRLDGIPGMSVEDEAASNDDAAAKPSRIPGPPVLEDGWLDRG